MGRAKNYKEKKKKKKNRTEVQKKERKTFDNPKEMKTNEADEYKNGALDKSLEKNKGLRECNKWRQSYHFSNNAKCKETTD